MPMDQTRRLAYARLNELLIQADTASYAWTKDGRSKEWTRDAEVALRRLFGETSDHLKEFKKVSYTPIAWFADSGDGPFERSYLSGMRTATSILRSAVKEVEDYELVSAVPVEAGQDATATAMPLTPKRTIFVVHGHDEAMKEAVARFLEKLALEAVVLGEQANRGATIIEKFKHHADVGFAIVLLSPDDVGAPKSDTPALQPRARQNAVLELGYFLGALGRERVCPLIKGPIELPSDMSGVVYVDFDIKSGWKLELVRELKAAGFDIDANAAF